MVECQAEGKSKAFPDNQKFSFAREAPFLEKFTSANAEIQSFKMSAGTFGEAKDMAVKSLTAWQDAVVKTIFVQADLS
eukprot:3106997-Pyramimonas_sp.AAC.1